MTYKHMAYKMLSNEKLTQAGRKKEYYSFEYKKTG